MGVGYMRWVLYLAMDLLLDRQQDLEQDHMTSAEAHIQHFYLHIPCLVVYLIYRRHH